MRKAGAQVQPGFVNAAFFRPVHADRVGLIYTRAFTDLKGITDAMDASNSRVLTQGIAEGAVLWRWRIVDRIDSIGIGERPRLPGRRSSARMRRPR
jgi:hypothetical protein